MHFMNRQRGRHMSGESEHEDGGAQNQGQGAKHPHIAIHSHSQGHTVHITHPDGQHESHDHEAGDAEGIAAHIHQHIGRDGEQRPGEGEEDQGGASFGRMGIEP